MMPQHEVPVQLCLRSGVSEAVTLLAKAMAVTKETTDLYNSIVKNVWG